MAPTKKAGKPVSKKFNPKAEINTAVSWEAEVAKDLKELWEEYDKLLFQKLSEIKKPEPKQQSAKQRSTMKLKSQKEILAEVDNLRARQDTMDSANSQNEKLLNNINWLVVGALLVIILAFASRLITSIFTSIDYNKQISELKIENQSLRSEIQLLNGKIDTVNALMDFKIADQVEKQIHLQPNVQITWNMN